jgi:endonuclease/exonuclease/phosphatase (EEP) superfamily protein YafD
LTHGRGRGATRALVAMLAVLHPLALAGVALAMRFVGEAWWPTTVLLYLPRWPLAAALPILVLALAVLGPRRLLWSQLVAAVLLLVPLGGFHWNRVAVDPSAPRLRILSLNVSFAHGARDVACREVAAHEPDLVLLQGYDAELTASLERCLAGYQRYVDGEFQLASRGAIQRFAAPPPLPSGPAGFVEYTVETPLGLIDLFNTHPISPRDGFERLQGDAPWTPTSIFERLRSAEARAGLVENTARRRAQVEALAAAMGRARHPVVVAGDTNLPGLSRLFAEQLGGLQDGFARAGQGFGYTFPAERPWMRIDRILAGPALRFTGFRVGARPGTTHLAVVAELQRR